MKIRFYLGYFRAAAAVLALLAVQAFAADITVIDLHNRTADDVLPVLRPLVGPDAVLSGVDYKLIIRASADEVARIREVLTVIDRTPKQLMVSVRYTGHPQGNATELGIAGTSTPSGSQVTARGGTTTHTTLDASVSSVRVLEGNGAHVSAGQSVPVVTAVLFGAGSRRQTIIGGTATEYRELNSGFDVLPRVNGDRVTLDISTQQERAVNQGQISSTVQRAATTVAGRLGEWIELGGVTSSVTERHSTVGLSGGGTRVTTQSDERTIAVKVEQVE